jgi:hypothetical protein
MTTSDWRSEEAEEVKLHVVMAACLNQPTCGVLYRLALKRRLIAGWLIVQKFPGIRAGGVLRSPSPHHLVWDCFAYCALRDKPWYLGSA